MNWLFVDLNSYFASVEQQVRPELRGRPVGVVPMMADTTVCIAASYEAKAFGVRTGTVVADAKKMCPEIVLVEGAARDLYRVPPPHCGGRGELPAGDGRALDRRDGLPADGPRTAAAGRDGAGPQGEGAHSGAGGPHAAQFGGPGHQPLPGQGGQRHGKTRRPGGAAAGHSARGAAASLRCATCPASAPRQRSG